MCDQYSQCYSVVLSYRSRSDDHDMSMIDCPAYGVHIPGSSPEEDYNYVTCIVIEQR